MILALFFLTIVSLWLALAGLSVYGIILSFKKKLYIGAVALFLPLFGLVIGTAKVIFKKDLLN
jgi:hypothetical protein